MALAAAMLTDPEVLLLDDPLRSLDPAERARLLAVPGRRRTVVLASRYPASEEGLVNQVALLLNGRLAVHARREDLAERGPAAHPARHRQPGRHAGAGRAAGGARVRRFGTVTGLALRELWISFRLLLAVGVLVAAALPSALLPHTTPALAASPLESPLEWFAIGLALALGVIGGMAAAALSQERRRRLRRLAGDPGCAATGDPARLVCRLRRAAGGRPPAGGHAGMADRRARRSATWAMRGRSRRR